jgi:hypothetical protein
MHKIVDREILEIENSDSIAYLLESKVWDNLTRKMFKDILSQWKQSLLTSRDLDQGTRVGYIVARQAIINAFQIQYKKHELELPKWLED